MSENIFEEIKAALHKEDLEFMQQADLMECIDSVIDRIAAKHQKEEQGVFRGSLPKVGSTVYAVLYEPFPIHVYTCTEARIANYTVSNDRVEASIVCTESCFTERVNITSDFGTSVFLDKDKATEATEIFNLVKDGFENGVIQFIPHPDQPSDILCQIGAHYFSYDDCKNITPERYREGYSMWGQIKNIVSAIMNASETVRTDCLCVLKGQSQEREYEPELE